MKFARQQSIETDEFVNMNDVVELKFIESSMTRIGERLHATRDYRIRLKMASDLDELRGRIDVFVRRRPAGISTQQFRYLRTAVKEINFTVALLRSPIPAGHA